MPPTLSAPIQSAFTMEGRTAAYSGPAFVACSVAAEMLALGVVDEAGLHAVLLALADVMEVMQESDGAVGGADLSAVVRNHYESKPAAADDAARPGGDLHARFLDILFDAESDAEVMRLWLAILLLDRLKRTLPLFAHEIAQRDGSSAPVSATSSDVAVAWLSTVDEVFFTLDIQGDGVLNIDTLMHLFLALVAPARARASGADTDANIDALLADPEYLCTGVGMLQRTFAHSLASFADHARAHGHAASPVYASDDLLAAVRDVSVSTACMERETAALSACGCVSLSAWRCWCALARISVEDLNRMQEVCIAARGACEEKEGAMLLTAMWGRATAAAAMDAARDLRMQSDGVELAACASSVLRCSLVVRGGGALLTAASEGMQASTALANLTSTCTAALTPAFIRVCTPSASDAMRARVHTSVRSIMTASIRACITHLTEHTVSSTRTSVARMRGVSGAPVSVARLVAAVLKQAHHVWANLTPNVSGSALDVRTQARRRGTAMSTVSDIAVVKNAALAFAQQKRVVPDAVPAAAIPPQQPPVVQQVITALDPVRPVGENSVPPVVAAENTLTQAVALAPVQEAHESEPATAPATAPELEPEPTLSVPSPSPAPAALLPPVVDITATPAPAPASATPPSEHEHFLQAEASVMEHIVETAPLAAHRVSLAASEPVAAVPTLSITLADLITPVHTRPQHDSERESYRALDATAAMPVVGELAPPAPAPAAPPAPAESPPPSPSHFYHVYMREYASQALRTDNSPVGDDAAARVHNLMRERAAIQAGMKAAMDALFAPSGTPQEPLHAPPHVKSALSRLRVFHARARVCDEALAAAYARVAASRSPGGGPTSPAMLELITDVAEHVMAGARAPSRPRPTTRSSDLYFAHTHEHGVNAARLHMAQARSSGSAWPHAASAAAASPRSRTTSLSAHSSPALLPPADASTHAMATMGTAARLVNDLDVLIAAHEPVVRVAASTLSTNASTGPIAVAAQPTRARAPSPPHAMLRPATAPAMRAAHVKLSPSATSSSSTTSTRHHATATKPAAPRSYEAGTAASRARAAALATTLQSRTATRPRLKSPAPSRARSPA